MRNERKSWPARICLVFLLAAITFYVCCWVNMAYTSHCLAWTAECVCVLYIQFVCLTKVAVVFQQLHLLVLHFAGNDFFPFSLFFLRFFFFYFLCFFFAVRGQVAKCRKSSSHQICWKAIGRRCFARFAPAFLRFSSLSTNALLLEFLHWVRALNFKSQRKIPAHWLAEN